MLAISVLPNDFVFVKQEPAYSGIHVSPAWGLDREMRRRLILQETWFTRERFFTSYFIDVDTFCFWIDLVRVLATTKNTSLVAAGYTRV